MASSSKTGIQEYTGYREPHALLGVTGKDFLSSEPSVVMKDALPGRERRIQMDIWSSNREQTHHNFRLPHGKASYLWNPANSKARMSQYDNVLVTRKPSSRVSSVSAPHCPHTHCSPVSLTP